MKNRIRNMLLLSSAAIATTATGCGLAALRTGCIGWMYLGMVGSCYMTLFCYANQGYLARKIARWRRKRQQVADDRFMLHVQQLIWMTVQVETMVDGIHNEGREAAGRSAADIVQKGICGETEQDGCAGKREVLGTDPLGESALVYQGKCIG